MSWGFVRGELRGHFLPDGSPKVQYQREKDAVHVARIHGKQVYKCSFCKQFHIGGHMAWGPKVPRTTRWRQVDHTGMGRDLARCTVESCEATPTCDKCGREKALRGRSYPLEMLSVARCDESCEGYLRPPISGHLFPGELAQLREDASA